MLMVSLVGLIWHSAISDLMAKTIGKASYREIEVAGQKHAILKMVFFDEKDFCLRVVANPDKKSAKGLDAIGQELGATAVCNGSYFEVPTLLPSGLEIADRKRTGVFLANPHGGGGIGVKDGKAAIIWDNEFQDDSGLTEYVHCSPWHIKEGIPWPRPKKPEDDPKNSRTFILTDMAGKWAIGIAKGIGLSELGHVLATPGVITEFVISRALNLDGGPSTGMWMKNNDGTESYSKPGWAVRNCIAVIPRGQLTE